MDSVDVLIVTTFFFQDGGGLRAWLDCRRFRPCILLTIMLVLNLFIVSLPSRLSHNLSKPSSNRYSFRKSQSIKNQRASNQQSHRQYRFIYLDDAYDEVDYNEGNDDNFDDVGLMQKIEWSMFAKYRNKKDRIPIRPGLLLISADKTNITSGIFQKSVVLITAITRYNFVEGLIVNKQLSTKEEDAARSILHFYNETTNLSALKDATIQLGIGGPVVNPDTSSWIHIHTYSSVKGSRKITPEIFIAGDIKQLLQLAVNATINNRANKLKLLYGVCSWLPGQLDFEIMNGDWKIYNETTAADVFDPPSTLWPKLQVAVGSFD